jgi:hypothetical protein
MKAMGVEASFAPKVLKNTSPLPDNADFSPGCLLFILF